MKSDIIEIIKQEAKFYQIQRSNIIVDYVFQRPAYAIQRFLKHLRMMEHYGKKDIRYYYHYYFYRRLSYKLGFQIPINTVDTGVKLFHWGCIIINGKAKIGKNCSIYPGVTVGKTAKGVPIIGDNCYLGLGSKVLGKVRIGNNVKILANAVVTKDIPDNCVVAGIPAKVIMSNEIFEKDIND